MTLINGFSQKNYFPPTDKASGTPTKVFKWSDFQKSILENKTRLTGDEVLQYVQGIPKNPNVQDLHQVISLQSEEGIICLLDHLSKKQFNKYLGSQLPIIQHSYKSLHSLTGKTISQPTKSVREQEGSVDRLANTILRHPICQYYEPLGHKESAHARCFLRITKNTKEAVEDFRNRSLHVEKQTSHSSPHSPCIKTTHFAAEYRSIFKSNELKALTLRSPDGLYNKGLRSDKDFELLGLSPERLQDARKIIKDLRKLLGDEYKSDFRRCTSFVTMKSSRLLHEEIFKLLRKISKDTDFCWNALEDSSSLIQQIRLFSPEDSLDNNLYTLHKVDDADVISRCKRLGSLIDIAVKHQLFAVTFSYLKQNSIKCIWDNLHRNGIKALSEIPNIQDKDVFALNEFN